MISISTIAFILLCAASVIQIVYLFIKRESLDPVSHFAILVASVLLLMESILRSIQINFIALTNLYESLIFFSAGIGIILFLIRTLAKDKLLPLIQFGSTIIAIALIAIASSPAAPDTIAPPIPALQSAWLVLHVSFAFIGESFFTVAFVAAIYYLFSSNEGKRIVADRIIYTTIAIGYPVFITGAIIFGAIWAKVAWGNYWSWDPKEIWALVTALVYTAYLHTRFVMKLKGKGSAILSIAGFLFTLFTLFGVNFLLSGLHSYA